MTLTWATALQPTQNEPLTDCVTEVAVYISTERNIHFCVSLIHYNLFVIHTVLKTVDKARYRIISFQMQKGLISLAMMCLQTPITFL
jgi:hypothetical protein